MNFETFRLSLDKRKDCVDWVADVRRTGLYPNPEDFYEEAPVESLRERYGEEEQKEEKKWCKLRRRLRTSMATRQGPQVICNCLIGAQVIIGGRHLQCGAAWNTPPTLGGATWRPRPKGF